MNRNKDFIAVRSVLIDHWDPIGIGQIAEVQNEYDSYVPGILRMLEQGAIVEVLTAHLGEIASAQMDLAPDENRDRKAAELLMRIQD